MFSFSRSETKSIENRQGLESVNHSFNDFLFRLLPSFSFFFPLLLLLLVRSGRRTLGETVCSNSVKSSARSKKTKKKEKGGGEINAVCL